MTLLQCLILGSLLGLLATAISWGISQGVFM